MRFAERLDQPKRIANDRLGLLVTADLEIRVVEKVHRMQCVIGATALLLVGFPCGFE